MGAQGPRQGGARHLLQGADAGTARVHRGRHRRRREVDHGLHHGALPERQAVRRPVPRRRVGERGSRRGAARGVAAGPRQGAADRGADRQGEEREAQGRAQGQAVEGKGLRGADQELEVCRREEPRAPHGPAADKARAHPGGGRPACPSPRHEGAASDYLPRD